MNTISIIRYSHNHHLLVVKGCDAEPDVLAFEGDQVLSTPFRYHIEVTGGVAIGFEDGNPDRPYIAGEQQNPPRR